MQELIYMGFLDVVVWYSWISFINRRLFSRIIQLLSIPHPMNWSLQSVIQPLQYWILQKYDLSLYFIQEIAYVNHSGAVTPDICALVRYLMLLLLVEFVTMCRRRNSIMFSYERIFVAGGCLVLFLLVFVCFFLPAFSLFRCQQKRIMYFGFLLQPIII